jgi:Na+-transporting NADH:ubiquinone oxidoreductase subunit NqrB
MRAYVIVAGLIFGLLALVHVWRMILEPHLARDPWYWLVTLAAAAFGVAAWRVVRRSRVP